MTPIVYHLYEIVLESPHVWLKLQASCDSPEQAKALFEYRFGGPDPNPPRPELRFVSFTFEVPIKISEHSDSIANWDAIREGFTPGWDDQDFHLAEGPYPWCETLSDDCDCHGIEGRLDVVYCSDLGLRKDLSRRTRKSPNVRHFGWRQEMARDDANVERYDKERLDSYWAAVLNMVKSEQALEREHEPDCLYLVIKVHRNNPRGEGTLTKVERDLTDPTGNSHRTTISRYPSWDVCLGILDGLLDEEAR